MKKHTKIYLDALGYSIGDFIPCEISGNRANDIHHIESRGMGGDPNSEKDRIENLMAVTRKYHELYGDRPEFMVYLFTTHKEFLETNGVKFDANFMDERINYYNSIN